MAKKGEGEETFNGMTIKKVKELPKKPKKNVVYEVKHTSRSKVTWRTGFVYTGVEGFGKFKIVYNRKA